MSNKDASRGLDQFLWAFWLKSLCFLLTSKGGEHMGKGRWKIQND